VGLSRSRSKVGRPSASSSAPTPVRGAADARAAVSPGLDVLLIPRAVRILLAAQRVDMRNSIDGLAAVIHNQWKEDLYAGDPFVFVSRRGDKAKVLTWDNGGFVLYYKRLEQGRFRLPDFHENALGARLQSSQLAMLLDGIDLSRVRRPKQWVPPHPPPKRLKV
jgi:transposase